MGSWLTMAACASEDGRHFKAATRHTQVISLETPGLPLHQGCRPAGMEASLSRGSPRFDQLCLEQVSALSDASDSSAAEEQHTAKARRYSGAFNDAKDATAATADSPLGDPSWTPEASASLYNVAGWSDGYYSVSEGGNLLVKPQGGELKRPCRGPPPAPDLSASQNRQQAHRQVERLLSCR